MRRQRGSTILSLSSTLDESKITLTPHVHYNSREEARAVCDPMMEAWALLIAVQLGFHEVQIDYLESDSIDRAPTPRDLVLQLEGVVGVGMAGTVSPLIAYDRTDSALMPGSNTPKPPGSQIHCCPGCQ